MNRATTKAVTARMGQLLVVKSEAHYNRADVIQRLAIHLGSLATATTHSELLEIAAVSCAFVEAIDR